MLEFALEAVEPYIALSYRWDDPKPNSTSKLTCNGIDVAVGSSLRDALLRIYALPGRMSYIWVDYICINQSDEEEKQAQILQMPEVYRRAEKVIIWLGEEMEETSKVMGNILWTIDLLDAVDDSRKPGAYKQLTQEQIKAYDYLMKWVDAAPNPMFEAIWNLLSRGWFSRVWTVQEAAVASSATILCGSTRYRYSTISNFALKTSVTETHNDHWIRLLHALGPVNVSLDPEQPNRPVLAHGKAVLKMQEAQNPSAQPSMVSGMAVRFLHQGRMLECTDPRDRIFSAIPFLQEDFINAIHQRRPILAKDLYILFASYELEKQNNIKCLSAAGLCYQHRTKRRRYADSSEPIVLDLPSWVPDWTCPKMNQHLWVKNENHLDSRGQHLFQPTGEVGPSINVVTNSIHPTLVVKGIIVDSVLDCAVPCHIPRLPAVVESHERPNVALDLTINMKEQVDEATSLALRLHSCKTSAEKAVFVHSVHRTILGDMMPAVVACGIHGLWIRANSDTIEQIYKDMEHSLEHLKQECERTVNHDLPYSPSSLRTASEISVEERLVQQMLKRPQLLLCMSVSYKGRRFFVTQNRRLIGIGPRILQPGDKICVFFGACTPFVIRPWRRPRSGCMDHKSHEKKGNEDEDGETRYELVGECYVDGLMDGQVLNAEGLTTQDIHLV